MRIKTKGVVSMKNHRLLLRLFTLVITLLFFTQIVIADESEADDVKAPFASKDVMVSRLKAILPIYEDAIRHPWPTVPDTEGILHIGSHNHAVVLLRERLTRSHDLPVSEHFSSRFDETLEDAVKLFQARHGLHADGVVGGDTLTELNTPPEIRLHQLQVNIQRWQTLATHLGHRYVLVNIPEYMLHLIDHDKEVLSIKTVVGKTDWPTPILSSSITHLVFNPHWSVPRMIAQNDIVPKMIDNPDYLNENNIRIFNSEEEGSNEISSDEVDWQSAQENGFRYHLRQDPGEKNALGLVKFEFQNSKDVYLHDTPSKSLFAKDKRNLSHGCVRLEHPFDLVTYLTQDDPRIDEGKVQEILDSHQTHYFRIKNPIPIYLIYLTAWVDDDGVINFRDDIYNLDQ